MGRTVVLCVCLVIVLGPITALAAIGSSYPTGVSGSGPAGDRAPSGPGVADGGLVENDTTGTTMEPGAQFAGVIGAHRERHEGAVEERRLDVRLSGADTPGERAEVVATVYQRNRLRLDGLTERKQELRRARRNGTMSDNEYRARSAVIDVELRSVERTAIRLEAVAEGLSVSLLLETGVDLEAIHDLRIGARELQGTELPMIAPSFTRDSNDSGSTPTSSGDDGSTNETLADDGVSTNVTTAIAEAETEVQTARDRVDRATQVVDETLASTSLTDLLDRARHNLSAAERRLESARSARDAGDERDAIENANEAVRFARTAIELAEAVIEEATGDDEL